MHRLHSTLTTITALATIYALVAWIAGPLTLAHFFITLTAIDHWHPNWPDPAVVDDIATTLPTLALALAVLCIVLTLVLHLAAPRLRPTHPVPGALGRTALAAGALAATSPHLPTREQFHASLCDALRDAGISAPAALDATDAAMTAHAATDTPADWAGTVRAAALDLAGLSGTYLRVHSREPRLEDTARFLTAYGYPALHVRRVGSTDGEEHTMNFDGIAVQHRTPARDAEAALIELLITAHQAHLASMDDGGSPRNAGTVQRHADALRHVATKLSLRGFVPPELDAQVGRDGIATADELEQWAIAQVVAACSPISRMPLPTMERTIEEGR